MTVRCPSCSANLKVNLERLGGRESARCPSCHASVPLPSHDAAQGTEAPGASASGTAQATLVVTCQSCKTRLKAPASRVGTRSACPKCRAMVLIEAAPAAGVLVASAGSDIQEESSSASTRRIDSRMIGMLSSSGSAQGSAGVDLEAFLKTGTSVPSRSPSETPMTPSPSDPGSVAPLLKPPVAAMEKIAKEIRQTAEHLTRAPETLPAAGTSGLAGREAGMAPTTPRPRRPIRSVVDHTEDQASHAADGSDEGFFAAWRGILSGGIAGLLVGGAQIGVLMSPLASYVPSLPFPASLLALPGSAIRILFAAMLGMIAGFIAGAAGSPRNSAHPLNMTRCGGIALLMGLACALVGGLVTGTGVQVWPIANWMRDLLVLGLLTPAVHRLLPAPRT